MLACLVNPSNGYSQDRITHYASGDSNDWDRLPEWNPATERVQASEIDAPGGAAATGLSKAAAPLALPSSIASLDDPVLLALGKAAFSRYPTQPAQYLAGALASRAAAAPYGVWVDGTYGVTGLVRTQLPDGSTGLAVTCSSCHASPGVSGAIVPGRPNAALDVGAARLAAAGIVSDPASPNPLALWGPGREDVTTSAGTEPARIPDLRPVRYLTYLQQDASVRVRSIVTLAIRIETLIITSNSDAVRPPRMVTLGLAVYLDSLAASLPSLDSATAASPAGAMIFATQCSSCHASPGLSGPPVPLVVVGTDPTLGLSASRGTGDYRVPSLHGVGTRGPLLHDGTLPSVDAMFDPARVTSSFTGRLHGSGAVSGHIYGLTLSDTDRQALLALLHAL
jgi:hypothetical protein